MIIERTGRCRSIKQLVKRDIDAYTKLGVNVSKLGLFDEGSRSYEEIDFSWSEFPASYIKRHLFGKDSDNLYPDDYDDWSEAIANVTYDYAGEWDIQVKAMTK